jgi:hypothetical protein
MTGLDLNQLFNIAQATDLLDLVEVSLHQAHQSKAAGVLMKLQQDCGIATDRAMSGADDIAAGPESAKLIAAYIPPTKERITDFTLHLEEKLSNALLYKRYVDFLDASGLSTHTPAPILSKKNFTP